MKALRWIFVVIVLVIGGVIRFHALDRQSLWDDEMSSVRVSALDVRSSLHRFADYEHHPPLYFWQLRLWRLVFGDDVGRLRANSAVWGTLSLLIFYLLARRFLKASQACLAMVLMAVAPLHIAYSQELRPYAFAVCAVMWAWLELDRFLKEETAGGLLFLSAGIELYAHYWGAFALTAQALYLLKAAPTLSRRFHGMLVLFGAGLLLLPWLPILRLQIHGNKALGFWVPHASLLNLGEVFVAYTSIHFQAASWMFNASSSLVIQVVAATAGLLLMVVGFWRGGCSMARFWLIIGLGIPFVISYSRPDMFVAYRYPFLMYPAAILLIASAVSDWRSGVLVFILIAINVQSWGYYFHSWEKANPKSVVAYVQTLRRPGSIVIYPFYFSSLYHLYAPTTEPRAILTSTLYDPARRARLRGSDIILLSFDVPNEPIGELLRAQSVVRSTRYFPGFAHLGITVYELSGTP